MERLAPGPGDRPLPHNFGAARAHKHHRSPAAQRLRAAAGRWLTPGAPKGPEKTGESRERTPVILI